MKLIVKLDWVMEVSIIFRREVVGRGLGNNASERRSINREDSQVKLRRAE